LGPISGSHQGQRPNGCIQRPDTWLHPNASQKVRFLLYRGRRPYITAVQHHTRSWCNSRHGGQRHQLGAGPTLYSAVLDDAVRPRRRLNRPAQALMPPLRLMNTSRGSEPGLYALAKVAEQAQDKLSSLRFIKARAQQSYALLPLQIISRALPPVPYSTKLKPGRFPAHFGLWPSPEKRSYSGSVLRAADTDQLGRPPHYTYAPLRRSHRCLRSSVRATQPPPSGLQPPA